MLMASKVERRSDLERSASLEFAISLLNSENEIVPAAKRYKINSNTRLIFGAKGLKTDGWQTQRKGTKVQTTK